MEQVRVRMRKEMIAKINELATRQRLILSDGRPNFSAAVRCLVDIGLDSVCNNGHNPEVAECQPHP